MKQHFICYYRTSTQKQNLGIEAQRSMTNNYIKSVGGIMIDFVEEQESGKNDNREGLERAIKLCEQHSSILLIAKLDRLSRSISFLFQLRDRVSRSNIEIKALDMPSFNTMSLGIYATMAQAERENISSRTKNALQVLKLQGFRLGNPQNLTAEAQQRGVDSIKLKARTNDQNRQAQAVIVTCMGNGMNYTSTAEYLNGLNYKTSKNKTFQATTVMRLYQRYLADQEPNQLEMVA